MKLSIAVPVFNEENTLKPLYHALTKVIPPDVQADFIFVNDGSQDGSLAILLQLRDTDKRIRIVDLSRNFGHQLAITAGMDHAQGDACLILDADLQHPPEILPQMLEAWRQGAQIVHAQRSDADAESAPKRWTAWLFYRLLRLMTRVNVLPDAADFCLLDAQVLQAYRQLREPHRFLRGLHQWVGYRHATVRYARVQRQSGHTKYTVLRMVRLALDAITSFSILPLRFAAYVGFLMAFLSVIYALYAIYVKFVVKSPVAGWTSLMIVILFIGGAQLLTLGILGEYIGRIYDQGKHRPLYLISRIYE